ncbi:MAG: FtsQ-type POTRA domain-containing protein [Peptococcaceae bacterium]|nr:FtsQ-type POTRA domain-containing protein [Peptococcaceae bacterium]
MSSKRLNYWETAFFLFVIAIAAFILVRSPLFEIQALVVKGNRLLTKEEICAAAAIVKGTHIFKTKLAAAEKRVEALPLVKDAEVHRDLPSTVVISVRERQPLALVYIDGAFWEVDEEGIPLRKAELISQELPVITGITVDQPDFNRLLEVASAVPTELRTELSEIHINADDEISVFTIDGIEVRLGQAEALENQILVMREVLRQIRQNGQRVLYIDLVDPDDAVIKYQGGGEIAH